MIPILYSSFNCPHSLKAAFFLNEKGIVFRRVEVDLSTNEQQTPTYLAINPKGTVPAFEDANGVIGDSLEIMCFVDEECGGHRLFPNDAATLREVRNWIERSDTDFWDVSHHLYWQVIQPPEEGTNWNTVARLKAKGLSLLEELDDILCARAYVCNELSAADIALLPWVYGYQRFSLTEPGQLPAVERWRDELSQREAFVSNYRQKGTPLQVFLAERHTASSG